MAGYSVTFIIIIIIIIEEHAFILRKLSSFGLVLSYFCSAVV